MKKITLALLSILSISLSAQDYFQQEVNYIIDVVRRGLTCIVGHHRKKEV